ncbi:MAG: ATP-binding protein [Ignavibacteria bacterium]|nr:ATP-binding protein [Ignavibacteria bacterium]
MWFLSRSKESSVLILDEPDVYMHADLQRKLIRMLNADSRQFIVATHSPEMMSEVQPESVIILNRRTRKSQASTSIVGVQEILRHFGSVHNLSLSRLGEHNRILFVEGRIFRYLSSFRMLSIRLRECQLMRCQTLVSGVVAMAVGVDNSKVL